MNLLVYNEFIDLDRSLNFIDEIYKYSLRQLCKTNDILVCNKQAIPKYNIP